MNRILKLILFFFILDCRHITYDVYGRPYRRPASLNCDNRPVRETLELTPEEEELLTCCTEHNTPTTATTTTSTTTNQPPTDIQNATLPDVTPFNIRPQDILMQTYVIYGVSMYNMSVIITNATFSDLFNPRTVKE